MADLRKWIREANELELVAHDMREYKFQDYREMLRVENRDRATVSAYECWKGYEDNVERSIQ